MKFKVTFNSPVVLAFIIICFFATILDPNHVFFAARHSSLANPMTYAGLFTHIFGHANLGHFIGNASYILLLGPMLEEKYGSSRLITIIAVAALVTGIVHYILFWNVTLCGASGIVFAFILLTSSTGFKHGEIPLTFILVALIYIGHEIFNGLTLNDNISHSAHIVGGLVGAVSGYKLNKKSEIL